ncbi:hypothetical protein [Pandoraea commovens]|uniref:Uncharacterized protein n=1 Tax=Pandoraea commovens TaxID=2508289 RepID=A0ABY5Q968_9BURK|nr:hypothetical protein [Pandoraea commovens]UVA77124.1 hypothetical protein NTU39_00270 [Pandoraea commovens]
MGEHNVTAVSEWQSLQELPMPTLASVKDAGAVYSVLKVAFVWIDLSECRAANLPAQPIADGKCALASILVDGEGRRELYRLPLSLSDWAFSEVTLARQGLRKYPSEIEFGCLSDRHYAEIL